MCMHCEAREQGGVAIDLRRHGNVWLTQKDQRPPITVTNNVMRHPTSGVHSTGEEPRRPDFAGLEIDDCEFRSWSDVLTCLVICLISAVITLALICLAVRSVWRWVS